MLGNVIQKVHQVIVPNQLEPKSDWKDSLSAMTEMELLKEVKEQLIKACLVKTKKLDKIIDFVFEMDERAYPKLQSLAHNYLKSMSKNEFLKQEVEATAHDYLRQLYTTYTTILSEYQGNNKNGLTKDKINLVLARYLNASFMMAKWRYFDDQPAPLGMWANVHKIIRVAEELSIMNKNLFLYDSHKKEMSIATLLKRGFMLDTLQRGSYTQLQIELTDRILKIWSTNPIITNRYTKQKEYQFFIHLDGDNRPQRIRGAKHHPDFRYWRTSRIVDVIENYLCAVDTRKPLDEFHLLTMAATEDVVSLFKKLRVDWCVKGYKRQRREEERVEKLSPIKVYHGINHIHGHIRFLQNRPKSKNSTYEYQSLHLVDGHQSMQGTNTNDNETWVMLEESQLGFSVQLGTERVSWLKVGALVGYTMAENSNSIALAEIKTVRKRTNGTYRVGLIKIGKKAINLKAKRVQKNITFSSAAGYIVNDGEDNMTLADEFAGLFIEGEVQERPKIVVPRYQFKRASRYQVNINGDQHMILAGEVLSNHRDWVCFEAIV